MTDANAPQDKDTYDEAAEERLRAELAPEESLLEEFLPHPSPIDGPAPAP
ncbi:hypothetical protein [Agromyces sp. Marseille-Q5079]